MTYMYRLSFTVSYSNYEVLLEEYGVEHHKYGMSGQFETM